MKLQKETKNTSGLHGKWYNDACGTAFALELIGERWSLLIVRELIFGPRRFSDLRGSLPGISAKVLTERLDGLAKAGVLAKRKLPPPASSQVYELTKWGYMAEPMIQELGRWAASSPGHDPTLPLSSVSLMLSLRTMIDRDAAREFDGEIGFDVANEQFVARLTGGKLPIARGDASKAQAIFRAPAAPLIAAAFYGRVPFDDLAAKGLVVEGDRALAERFATLFRLPPKVA